jgi:hypothetical protein
MPFDLDIKDQKAKRLATHVQELCAEHEITYEEVWNNGWAKRSRRLIRCPPVRGIVSYFLTLHEIGHIVAPGAGGGIENCRLTEEGLAWQWALANCAAMPTKPVCQKILKGLESYERRTKRRPNMIVPPAADVFWAVWHWAECGGPLSDVLAAKAVK